MSSRSGGRSHMGRAVKSAAVAADGLRPPSPGAVILLYHRVGGGADVELDLPTAVFEEQMAALAETGRVTSLGDALARLDGERAGPDPVVVTFDDGTADFVDNALPALVRHGIPATYYVATDFVERQRPFPHDGQPISWRGLAEAVSTSLVDIGSHTHTHVLLDRAAAVTEELDRSIELIEDRLEVTPRDFAYPKAVAGSPEAETEVRQRFRSGALAGCRPNPYQATDLHRLARHPIQRSDGTRYFRHKLAGGMRLEGELRRTLNRLRYRSAAV